MSYKQHRIRVTTLADLLLTAVDQYPDTDAVIFPDERVTYSELRDNSYAHARRLRGLGVTPGAHVGILMANCIEYLELIAACSLLGAVAVPMNARYKPSELAYVIENADLVTIVTSDRIADYADFALRLSQALPGLPSQPNTEQLELEAVPQLNNLVMLGSSEPAGFVTEEEYLDCATRTSIEAVDALRVKVQLEDSAIMMYTSGTTANPKGCPLSHGLLVRNGINMNRERYFLNPGEVFWAPLPMFHMAAILPWIACLDARAAISSMVHVEAGLALDMLERDRCAVAFPSFPTVTNELISHPKFEKSDLSNLRRINNVAPIEMLRQFQDAFPQAVQTGAYGLTEAGGVIAFNHPDESLETRLTTCGIPFPGIEVKTTDPESGEPQPANQRGELWIRGYSVFNGYYKSPEKNAECFLDGWFRTGDLCSISDEGAISYHGRLKDMLKVGGENVAAIEIESCLAKHPAVALAQVIGRADDRLEEVPVAFVEPVPGIDIEKDDLIAHCKAELASFKVPREVIFVKEWPMSSTKVQKFRLRELL